ncbi:putative Tartrate dehydrogenase [Streptomyces viridochromogenes Tue57]|uniref:Putative Tartrate dehydrogenase n=1 Tax=Streptomyces viridochromogenes Tue57 TaxID=1160705 RepID=L8PSC4_STRVR|nr:putative Tartrate dehydrogenase [Streptomyces viridochromogenes Tue57]
MTTNHRIALIRGDGIGTEVLPPAQQVLDVLGRRHGFSLSYTSYDWSCERTRRPVSRSRCGIRSTTRPTRVGPHRPSM